MTAYQGPHAAVTQQFAASPAAVAIEDLPPAIVATAFDVFKKENIGSHYGIIDNEIAWADEDGNSVDKVVYDINVIDQRAYDFYPPTMFANSSKFGNIDLELTSSNISSTGPTITRDKDYSIPNVEQAAGSCSGIIPYYDKTAQSLVSSTTDGTTENKLVDSAVNFTTLGIVAGDKVVNTTDNTGALVTVVDGDHTLSLDGDIMTTDEAYTIYRPIKILSTDLDTIIIPNGSVVTAQIKPGQSVLMLATDETNTAIWTNIGTVQSVSADETKVNLASPVAAAITASQIIIGCDTDTTVSTGTATTDTLNKLVDTGANFVLDGVAVGDIAYNTTDNTQAAVTAVDDLNTLSFGSDLFPDGDEDYTILRPKRSVPNTLYDPNADFITNKVAVGDVLYFSSQAITGTVATPETATVTSIINKNTLKFNTQNVNAGANGHIDSNFLKYMYTTVTPGSTVSLYSYDIKRLVGFSQNYQYKYLNSAAGVPVTKVSETSFSIPFTVGSETVPAPTAGDIFAITDSNIGATTEDRAAFTYMRLYKMDTVQADIGNSKYIINTTSTINISSNSATVAEYSDSDLIHAWNPKIETDIVADFRAVRIEETQVVKRITSIEDIFTNWVRSGEEEIDPRNELAFMMSIAFQSSGRKVCYGINVDATAANLSTEYGLAFDEMALYDVYSHAFGTTNSGVNGTVAAYCNAQAEPYEGHERIGAVCYDQENVFLQASDTGSNTSAGLITINGSVNLITAGVTVGDTVDIYTSAGVFVEQVSVTTTPSVSTQAQTDGETTHAAGHIYKFRSGRKDDQAVKIGALGLEERRVTIIWPGYFTADYGDETITAPPYFITAAIAGLDSQKLVSQSFTNMPFAIPGLSNIQLSTSGYYKKISLDEMGGGGIDVMIQDGSVTQVIKSRHDLTSDMSSIQARERSITKQGDVSAKTIRNAVAPYVGRYNITNQLFSFLGQICSIASTRLVKSGVIYKLGVDSIKRDETIDDKINFHMTATAFVAGNYYDITLFIVTR